MYANVNFETKAAFRQAVLAGQDVALYSPAQGPAIRGRYQVEGPWPGTVGPRRWRTTVLVENAVIVGVEGHRRAWVRA